MDTNQIHWQYFFADHDSSATRKLNDAEREIMRFHADRSRLADMAPAGWKVVALAELEEHCATRVKQFGIEATAKQKHKPSAAEWRPLPAKPDIYLAKSSSAFYHAQQELVFRLHDLPHVQAAWVLDPTRVPENKKPPHSGIFFKTPCSKEETSVEIVALDARRLLGGWLLRVPLNPRSDSIYYPPSSRMIGLAVARAWAGRDFNKLPPFRPQEPLAGVPVYEHLLRRQPVV